MIIAMWSGPRNLSTAMMRSFGARADCAVMDEPFFAPFLNVSGKAHPGREETLAAHETDPDKVAALCLSETSKPYVFQKHMPRGGRSLSWRIWDFHLNATFGSSWDVRLSSIARPYCKILKERCGNSVQR